ncbi:MAG: YMGG-like glycine zipper-containing protein, partial [Pyrinomonadaceae bacterium]
TAQFNVSEGDRYPSNTGTATDSFIIRDGDTVIATLDNNLSTEVAKEGDPFSMTVRQPSQYDGAVITGTISNVSRSGRVSGRSGVTLNFDNIRLRNGETYRFAGFVESVRMPGGETVRVDNEGAVREGDSQTDRTVQRTAIGTAVGAIIGAIAGGGKGAAIGAIIGAGAGAGSVYVQGRDDLELTSGTEVTIRASAPNIR